MLSKDTKISGVNIKNTKNIQYKNYLGGKMINRKVQEPSSFFFVTKVTELRVVRGEGVGQ